MTINIKHFDIEFDKNINKQNFGSYIYKLNDGYIDHNTTLLNVNKLIEQTNKQIPINLFEKFVYDIAEYHCLKLNFKIEDVFIEFWLKTNKKDHSPSVQLHRDSDEVEKKNNNYNINRIPVLSIVTYLTTVYTSPTIITDIDNNRLANNTTIFSFPKKYQSISFYGGKYYHGQVPCFLNEHFIDNDLRIILAINLWLKEPPKGIPFFDFDKCSSDIQHMYCNSIDNTLFKLIENSKSIKHLDDKSIKTIVLDESDYIINNDVFLYYEKEILKHINYFSIFLFTKFDSTLPLVELEQGILLTSNTNRVSNFKNSNEMINASKQNVEENLEIYKKYTENRDLLNIDGDDRFMQRFVHTKVFSKDICDWIIYESELYANVNGWMVDRHNRYPTTDIPIQNLRGVFKFITKSFFDTIKEKITSDYCISNNKIFDVIDMFVVKYSADGTHQDFLEMHFDNSLFTATILLNNKKEFDGGGTYYKDGIVSNTNIGDMIIHTQRHVHSGIKITRGIRYLLVFFINIINN